MPPMRPLRPTDPREVAGHVLRGRLGEGGQGTVFFGTSPSGQSVAVKLLHAHFGENHEARRHFHRELAALRRVAPFCTARILAADPDADPPYVVSEYVDGPSLQQAVRERGVLTGADLERLAIATATALGAIHAAGVVHRDFKPANVLLAADGPRVIDFGIARPLDATAATVSGVVGTPAYMAPEQLAGDPAGPPLDMFAWACTITYAAGGRPPFGQEPLPAVINRILNGEPDLGPLAGKLRGFVTACLVKDPARRPSAQQVLLGLMDERGDGRIFPSTVAPPPPRQGPSGPSHPAPSGPPRPAHSGPAHSGPARSGPARSGPAPLGPVRSGPAPSGSGLPGAGFSGPGPMGPAYPGPAHSVPPGPEPATRPSQGRVGVIAGSALAVGVAALVAVIAVIITNQGGGTAGPTGSPTPSRSATTAAVGEVARSPRLGLEVWQEGASAPMSLDQLDGLDDPVTTVSMKRAPFELRFPALAKDRALQVCAYTDRSVFSIADGDKVADHSCFRPGTGVADYEYGSGTLYLNKQGHNYLVGTRVARHSDTQDKVLFSTIFRDDASTPVTEQREDLYLAVFTDLNGDGVFKRAGEGEYEFVVLDFPS